jgi:hypothetical protein
MIKININKFFLTTLIIMIISIIIYYFWTSLKLPKSEFIIVILIGILFFGISFAGIFAGIKESKSVRKKILAGLFGNIILNVLFLIALFYVVLTMK